MELFYCENEVPILAPDEVAVLDMKTTEFERIKILVVLQVWVATNECSDINSLSRVVAKLEADGEITLVGGGDD